jgi:hypothetical protein
VVVGINQINDFGECHRVSIRTETFDKSLDLIHEWFRWLGWVKSFDKLSIKTPLPRSIRHHPIRAFESNELIVNYRPNLLNKWSRDHHGPNKKANR